jgi:hypothetical protein
MFPSETTDKFKELIPRDRDMKSHFSDIVRKTR